MLFEPTYVIPDLRNGLGNGVVDITNGLTVSWRVNGQPYMTAYKIEIFTTGAGVTTLYNTGKVPTTATYAFDGDGNPQFFEATIAASALSALSNGNEYQLQITQWWGDGANDYIVQNSPSVFLTRAEPTIAINAIGDGTDVPEEQVDYPQASDDDSGGDGEDEETPAQKAAIMNAVSALAYTVDNGQDYYDTLYNALYQSVPVSSITAVFVQGQTVVYDNGSLGELREMLTVYANFSDGSSYPVTAYVLTGTLAPGTSTITVSYQGQTTTFTVTVTHIQQIHSVNYTFTGTYIQANGDGMTYIRWRIAVLGEEDEPIYDTGNLYGVAYLTTSYMGFMTGVNYAIRLNGQTQSGVVFDTGWVPFGVSYETEEGSTSLIATPICGGVNLNFTGAAYILGTAYGSTSITNGILRIQERSYAVWNQSNGQPLNLMPPLTVVFSGAYFAGSGGDTRILTFGQTNSTVWLDVYEEKINGTKYVLFSLENSGGTIWNTTQIAVEDSIYFKVILTPVGSYVLYSPESDLWTRNTGEQSFGPVTQMPVIDYFQIGSSYNTGTRIQSDYFEIMSGSPDSELLAEMLDKNNYVPAWKPENYMLADFNDGTLNAGQEKVQGEILGYDLYRRTLTGSSLTLAARLDSSSGSSLFDYSVVNGTEGYEWRIFPRIRQNGQVIYENMNSVSNSVQVCFWSWMILEASPTETKNVFEVQAVYRFGKNLESGSSSNNNSPSVRENLTPYPTVQKAHALYKSGSLSSLIGVVDAQGNYSDTISQRDAIFALSTTENALFLKNRKGDLLRIAISGEISAITMDNTREQAQSMTVPWVEIGPAANVSLIGYQEM